MTSDNFDFFKDGQVYFTFAGYLDKLRSNENLKPPSDRRSIPTVKDLATAVGVHEITLHNIVNGKVKRLNIDTVESILNELWRIGFEPQITDFIQYAPPQNSDR